MIINIMYKSFVEWLERVRENSPPSASIVAYNFGIFESTDGYIVYLSGSHSFDPGDDDWTCNRDYIPTEKYFHLPASFSKNKNWQEIQQNVVGLVKEFLASPEFAESFLRSSIAITVGFDDGEIERVK